MRVINQVFRYFRLIMIVIRNIEKHMSVESLIHSIENYISSYLLSFLKLSRNTHFKIEDVIISNYNINVIIKIGVENYLLRINVEQQSGMPHQLEIEYKIHKYLSQFKITPQVFLIDISRNWIPYDFILEEFTPGDHLNYDDLESIRDAAKILAKLHSIPIPNPNFLIMWRDPLEDLLKELAKMYEDYEKRRVKNRDLLKYGKLLLHKLQKITPEYKNIFKPNSIVHTDVVNDNFLRSNKCIKIIDWEKPRIDDESYDLCVFLGKPPQLWASKRLMTEYEKNVFIETYSRFRNIGPESIIEKIFIRQPYVSFRWILWASHRKADVDEKIIPSEIIEFHKKNYHRYEKTSALENLIELIELIENLN